LRRRRRAELRRDLWGPALIDAWCPLGGALRAVQRSRDLLCPRTMLHALKINWALWLVCRRHWEG
jgi:hypothetical protein